jgi:cob(I)alamin adenosyltransferase
MDFRLTKKEDAERDKLIAELNLRQTRLEEALENYNANMEQEQVTVQEALDNYNAALDEAREFASDIASQADSDMLIGRTSGRRARRVRLR